MKAAKKYFFAFWDIAFALAAAVSATLWLSPTVVSLVTTEVIAFFTIQSAIILPAMIFTAGLLKGEGLTVAEVDQHQRALRLQMQFWIVLLCLDLLAVAILIVGKAMEWKWHVSAFGLTADVGCLLIGLATFCAALAVLRMVPFIQGVVSLLDLNGWLARKAVEARLQSQKIAAAPASETAFTPPAGYGRIISHPKPDKKAG